MQLIQERIGYLEDCTLGWLYVEDLRLATIERPWIPNLEGIGGRLRESCIPDGIYNIRPHTSQKFPNTYALVNQSLGVFYQNRPAPNWGRTAILIHVGNRASDVLGCIAVGQRHGWLDGKHAVLSSRSAMGQLREVMGRDHHSILIRPTAGTEEVAA